MKHGRSPGKGKGPPGRRTNRGAIDSRALQAVATCEAYRQHATAAGQPTPVLVEDPLAGEIGVVAVQSIADLITLDVCVTDLKTASKKLVPISGDQR
jgi:hypothetical protein